MSDETNQSEPIEKERIPEETSNEQIDESLEQLDSLDISSDDRLWSAVGYPIPFIAIAALLLDEKKERPFIRYHAIQSLVFNVTLWLLIFILSALTLGVASICAPLLWLVTFWPAYDSFRGFYTQIPFITNFLKNQDWV